MYCLLLKLNRQKKDQKYKVSEVSEVSGGAEVVGVAKSTEVFIRWEGSNIKGQKSVHWNKNKKRIQVHNF